MRPPRKVVVFVVIIVVVRFVGAASLWGIDSRVAERRDVEKNLKTGCRPVECQRFTN